jgi:hypothetical protein
VASSTAYSGSSGGPLKPADMAARPRPPPHSGFAVHSAADSQHASGHLEHSSLTKGRTQPQDADVEHLGFIGYMEPASFLEEDGAQSEGPEDADHHEAANARLLTPEQLRDAAQGLGQNPGPLSRSSCRLCGSTEGAARINKTSQKGIPM